MGKNCNDGAVARAYEIRKIQKVSEMKDMMPLSILSTHTSKSAENRPRKIDFTIFSRTPQKWIWEALFGGRNFKSAKQGQSVQKSRKSGFRDNTFYRGLIGQRIVSDTQKNI